MHSTIEQLEEDHKRIICLMFSLGKELEKLSGANPDQCDLDKVFEMLDYIQTVPEQWHHPIESIIYNYYLDRINPDCELALNLEAQHVKLEALSKKLLEHLSNAGASLSSRSARTISLFTQYQSEQLSHINKERELFKLIDENMTSEDWKKITDAINKSDHRASVDEEVFSLNYYRTLGNLISKKALVTEKISPNGV